MTTTPTQARREGLPAWRIIWSMVRFRPWLWLLDLGSAVLFRFMWQVAPGLILRAFFDMLTGKGQVGLGVWTFVALIIATYAGQRLGTWGFVAADVPIFADIATLLRTNLLKHILKRPGAAPLPDSPGEAVSRFRGDVTEIDLPGGSPGWPGWSQYPFARRPGWEEQ